MRFSALLLALALPFAACDQTAIPTNPVDLLADARIARQGGDIDRSVELYEAAFANDPSDALIRIELSAALFEQADLGIANLDEITRTFAREVSSGGARGSEIGSALPAVASDAAPIGFGLPAVASDAAPIGQGLAPVGATLKGGCAYADDPDAEAFDPRGFEGYEEYLVRAPVATRVLDLLDPVINDVVRPADFLCNGITDGELNYDASGALTALRAVDARLTEDHIASALAMNAVSLVLKTYGFLTEDLNDQTDWYRLSNGTLGICPTTLTETELRDFSAEAIADFGEALVSIDLRSELLNTGDVSTELVGLVLDVYQEFRDDLAPYCTTGS